MPVSALPSRTGVGELGAQAYHFIDLLRENGVKIWQILPLIRWDTAILPISPIPPAREMSCTSAWTRCRRRDCCPELPPAFGKRRTGWITRQSRLY